MYLNVYEQEEGETILFMDGGFPLLSWCLSQDLKALKSQWWESTWEYLTKLNWISVCVCVRLLSRVALPSSTVSPQFLSVQWSISVAEWCHRPSITCCARLIFHLQIPQKYKQHWLWIHGVNNGHNTNHLIQNLSWTKSTNYSVSENHWLCLTHWHMRSDPTQCSSHMFVFMDFIAVWLCGANF